MEEGNRAGENGRRSIVDLLKKMTSSATSSSSLSEYRASSELTEGVELTLGLSLGGRFGVDRATLIPGPPSGKRLTKSSSIAGIRPLPMEVQESFEAEEVAVVGSGEVKTSRPLLTRTTSMPVERDDEDWRKRKEKQSLRRMEAKRRRSEKLRGYGSLGDISGTSASLSSAAEAVAWEGDARPGPWNYMESMRFTINQPFRGRRSQESRPRAKMVSMEETDPYKIKRQHKCMDNWGKEIGRSAVEELPCVFTEGEGPNGRRVEGILYKYGKGEEVKIMCVCHESFLSPAEFVRHAGRGEVSNPLRHIVVNPFPRRW